jgi:hypothetical protein
MKILKLILLGSVFLSLGKFLAVGHTDGDRACDGGGKPRAAPTGSPSGRPRSGSSQELALPTHSEGVASVAAAMVGASEEDSDGEEALLESYKNLFDWDPIDYLNSHPMFDEGKADFEDQDAKTVWDRQKSFGFVRMLMDNNRDELFLDILETMGSPEALQKFAELTTALKATRLAAKAVKQIPKVVEKTIKNAKRSMERYLVPSIVERRMEGLADDIRESVHASIRAGKSEYKSSSKSKILRIVGGLTAIVGVDPRAQDDDKDDDDDEEEYVEHHVNTEEEVAERRVTRNTPSKRPSDDSESDEEPSSKRSRQE